MSPTSDQYKDHSIQLTFPLCAEHTSEMDACQIVLFFKQTSNLNVDAYSYKSQNREISLLLS